MGQVYTIGSRSKPVLNRVVVCLGSFSRACCGLGYEKDHQEWEQGHQMEVQQLPRRSSLCRRPSRLISSRRSDIQSKVSNLGRYAKMTGLKINTAKTMTMCWNNTAGRKVQVDGEERETVSKFVYRGGIVTQEGGSDQDIKRRLKKARAAFSKLRNIWKGSQLKLKTKLKI